MILDLRLGDGGSKPTLGPELTEKGKGRGAEGRRGEGREGKREEKSQMKKGKL